MASDVFGEYLCTYCQEEMRPLRVICAECPAFELCLQCFSAGAEIGCHKKDHSYTFTDCDIFDRSGWTTREELLLLNAVESFGYGNWKDIGHHIGTRTPEEAKDKYVSRYVSGEIGRCTWEPKQRNRCQLTDITVGLEDDPQAAQFLPPTKQPIANLRLEDIKELAYLPLRDEFEEEYDNEAELLVSQLTVCPDDYDDDLDAALKLTHLEMYNQRLRERARRHRVVRDNQLISQFFNKVKPKKKISREEKELGDKLRPLCKEKEQFIVEGVLKQRQLSLRVVELMRYRRNGLVKLEEIPHFDQERQLKHNSKPGSAASSIHHFSVSSKKKEKSELCRPGAVAEREVETAVERLSDSAHLLSPAETQLCSALNIAPNQYISMKTLMLAEPQLKVEGDCGPHILDHLVSSGWVSSAVSNPT